MAAANNMGVIAMKVFADGAMYTKDATFASKPDQLVLQFDDKHFGVARFLGFTRPQYITVLHNPERNSVKHVRGKSGAHRDRQKLLVCSLP